MERSAEIYHNDRLRLFHFLPVFLAALCFVGAVTGTIVFARAYTDVDVEAFIDSQRSLPVDFAGYFIYGLLEELPFFAFLLFSAMLVPGWIIAPAALLIGGLKLGTSICCLYSGCGLWGVLYALPVIAAPALCVLISLAILCHGSMLLSMWLFRSVFHPAGSSGVVCRLIIKIPLCAAINLAAAAFAAWMRTIMYSFIS